MLQVKRIGATVAVGPLPRYPVFDGANIRVPNRLSDSVSVVRASTGAVLTTPAGNGLDGSNTHPLGVCSDGLNIWVSLITNQLARF